MEWEPAPVPWDLTIEHFWQVQHIKVIKIAVTACGIPLSHNKFPFAEGENNIADFMNCTWSHDGEAKWPTFLAIDKGCKVMTTLNAPGELHGDNGWMQTTNIKVDTWHYNGHSIDALCMTWCNLNDKTDLNLVWVAPAVQPPHLPNASLARQADRNAVQLQHAFNFEAAEHLNAYLKGFSAVMMKMRLANHDLFLSIILRERAQALIETNNDNVL
ncbi:hypothetical protein NEOLEDRAFT_1076509 [Neolentinus lepideus HHB14362 ss-1]|uniref:Uncharacterized protein n=1 Tax=Neolentinus lepideus HHB14362 ss-1 TaxID=1314782 RepID=A0A165NSS9_9AGAM|nr:hypothetical protein NEOLEDRAFT_1076509 [Neolentinus lepideus HHB14362 ss-1]